MANGTEFFGVLFRMGKEEYLWGGALRIPEEPFKKIFKTLDFRPTFQSFLAEKKKQAKTILNVTNCFQWTPPMTSKAI